MYLGRLRSAGRSTVQTCTRTHDAATSQAITALSDKVEVIEAVSEIKILGGYAYTILVPRFAGSCLGRQIVGEWDDCYVTASKVVTATVLSVWQ